MLIKRLLIYTVLAVICMNVSCNHFYYQPDRRTHYTPAHVQQPFAELSIPTPDGLKLAAWHLQPPADKRRKVTVVQFHGNAENMTTHFMYVAWLAPLGFDVVTFDYRGYGQSDGVAERAGTIVDGQAVLHYVKNLPELADTKLFVVGQSLGGAVSIVAIATDDALNAPGAIAGLALDSTFHSYRGMARMMLAKPWVTWPLQYPLSFLITDELSPVDYVTKLTTKIEVWHAPGDPVVPYAAGRALVEPVKDKVEWHDVEEAAHTASFVSEEGRRELVDFLTGAD